MWLQIFREYWGIILLWNIIILIKINRWIQQHITNNESKKGRKENWKTGIERGRQYLFALRLYFTACRQITFSYPEITVHLHFPCAVCQNSVRQDNAVTETDSYHNMNHIVHTWPISSVLSESSCTDQSPSRQPENPPSCAWQKTWPANPRDRAHYFKSWALWS